MQLNRAYRCAPILDELFEFGRQIYGHGRTSEGGPDGDSRQGWPASNFLRERKLLDEAGNGAELYKPWLCVL